MRLEINPAVKYQEPWQFRLIYPWLKAVLAPFIRLIFVKKVTGLENIPKTGPAIITPNHESFLDFFCLSAVVKRPIHYLTAESRYDHFFERQLMKTAGQIRIERLNHDKGDIYSLVMSILSQGRLFGIFPEGRRSRTGEMLTAFTGVAKFAAHSEVPVIPVGIKNGFEIWPRHKKLPKLRKQIEIKIGEPMHFGHYNHKIHGEEIYRDVTNQIMRKISGLTGKPYLF